VARSPISTVVSSRPCLRRNFLKTQANIWCQVEPAVTALCHCLDCQKWTGSGGSANVGVPTSEFHITKGTPKQFTRVANSGKNHTQFFCGSKLLIPLAISGDEIDYECLACGSGLFSQMDAMEGVTFVKAGSLNDGANDIPVKIEFFVRSRPGYEKSVEGAQQLQTME